MNGEQDEIKRLKRDVHLLRAMVLLLARSHGETDLPDEQDEALFGYLLDSLNTQHRRGLEEMSEDSGEGAQLTDSLRFIELYEELTLGQQLEIDQSRASVPDMIKTMEEMTGKAGAKIFSITEKLGTQSMPVTLDTLEERVQDELEPYMNRPLSPELIAASKLSVFEVLTALELTEPRLPVGFWHYDVRASEGPGLLMFELVPAVLKERVIRFTPIYGAGGTSPGRWNAVDVLTDLTGRGLTQLEAAVELAHRVTAAQDL
jgi:hypothetical protein